MTAFASPNSAAEAPILAIVASAAQLAHELLDVLRREGEALAAMRLKAPTGFAEAKNRLVVAYSYKLEELQEAVMAPEAKGALAELKALNAEVMAAARRNAAALEGALEGNRRLLDRDDEPAAPPGHRRLQPGGKSRRAAPALARLLLDDDHPQPLIPNPADGFPPALVGRWRRRRHPPASV